MRDLWRLRAWFGSSWLGWFRGRESMVRRVLVCAVTRGRPLFVRDVLIDLYGREGDAEGVLTLPGPDDPLAHRQLRNEVRLFAPEAEGFRGVEGIRTIRER